MPFTPVEILFGYLKTLKFLFICLFIYLQQIQAILLNCNAHFQGYSLTSSLVSSIDDDLKKKWLVHVSFSYTCLWTHQHPSDVYPVCTLLSWLPLRGFLSANTDLSVCETREFSIPLSRPRTTNQILAEIIPWVPLGERNPIHVSKVAASLKVDNQSLCDANRRSSQQTLSPAPVELHCCENRGLSWMSRSPSLLDHQSGNSILLLFKLDLLTRIEYHQLIRTAEMVTRQVGNL